MDEWLSASCAPLGLPQRPRLGPQLGTPALGAGPLAVPSLAWQPCGEDAAWPLTEVGLAAEDAAAPFLSSTTPPSSGGASPAAH
eukprot:SAG11_NODE_35436_length_266_cov_1.245509_1_plen_83_part_10